MPTQSGVNFSELIRTPVEIVARLFHGGIRGLRLIRRNAPDLYITTAEREEQANEVMRSSSRMFHSLLNDPRTPNSALERALADAHPWVRFLPQSGADEFLIELIETTRASTELDSIAPIFQVITEWKHTAEVYADPELAKPLLLPSEGVDHGVVPMPEVTKK